jgi:hypothetical protein
MTINHVNIYFPEETMISFTVWSNKDKSMSDICYKNSDKKYKCLFHS